MKYSGLTRTSVFLLLATAASCSSSNVAPTAQGKLTRATVQKSDWLAMGDQEFAKTYAPYAFSKPVTSIYDRSVVAWMLFARANKNVGTDRAHVSAWEVWPDNHDTFAKPEEFNREDKTRLKINFSLPKKLKGSPPSPHAVTTAGDEITRNHLSFDYIIDNGLNTKAGVKKRLSDHKYRADFTIGAVEVKGYWVKGALPEAYQYVGSEDTFSLVGMHIMAKMRPTPTDAFTSEAPSWFWTTFEFKGNLGLTHAQGFITYGDDAPSETVKVILEQAKLWKTAFRHYRSNGTQIRFSDTRNEQIILGNTKLEDFAAIPKDDQLDPVKWTNWYSSCHSCHATASFNMATGAFFKFVSDPPSTNPIGKLTATAFSRDPRLFNDARPIDFNWSIAFNAK